MATKYTVLKRFCLSGNRQFKPDMVIELDDKEAKPLAKAKAIGIYFEDGEEPEVELPKAKPRRAKPRTPKPLDESKLVEPDPRAK